MFADRRKIGLLISAAVAISAFFAITSPYNAVYYLPFAARFIYWLGLILISIAIERSVVGALLRSRFDLRLPLRLVIGSTVATPAVWVTIFSVQMLIGHSIAGPILGHAYLMVQIWVICLALAVLTEFFLRFISTQPPASSNIEGPPASAVVEKTAPANHPFRALLPLPHRNAEIYAVSAEDHYIRVHTSAGETMLLMRLSNAEKLLQDVEGVKTHRSWWVAQHGVNAITKNDGKISIALKSGTIAPASRSGAKEMKDKNWV